MSLLKEIRRTLAGKAVQVTHCGGLNCQNYVEVGEGPQPDIHICSECSARMNEGIVRFLHANTGKIVGGYHATDGYKP